jgi:uncharacterized protein (TIGR02145 family)
MHSLLLLALLLTHAAAQPAAPLQYANKTYKTAKIGTQTWLAENLNYEAEGSVCYENNPANCAKYGRLYNWETAMKACPKGWHLPSNAEWDKLLRFVDGDTGTKSPYSSETAGKHLKTVSGWNFYKEYYGNGTNDYGFSALPSGNGGSDGSFNGVGHYGGWWSAGKYNSDYAYGRSMIYYREYAHWYYSDKSNLYSVRCLQD